MKILLLKTPNNFDDPYDYTVMRQPYGLAILSAVLKEKGYDVTLWDPQPLHKTKKEILEYVYETRPDILGMRADTHQVAGLISFIEDVKNSMPETKVIIGGPHVTAEPELTLKNYRCVDWICIGEGELVMLELLEKLEKGLPLTDISGFACRDEKGEIVVNPIQQIVEDQDSLPFADYDSLPMNKYMSSFAPGANSAAVIASRGCPYSCIFCAASVVTGKKIRKKSPSNFVSELIYLHEKHGITDFILNDSTFNFDNKWARDICNEILDRFKSPITWQCTARADHLDKETVKLMKKSGCNTLFIGIESADPHVLKLMKKGEKIEDIEKGLNLCEELEIPVCATFVLGLPGETIESMNKTIKLSKKIMANRINQSNLFLSTPLPGTELYSIALKEGMEAIDWSQYNSYKISYVPESVSRQELEKAYKKALKGLYFNISYALHRLKSISSWQQLKFNLHQAKGVFSRGLNVSKGA